MTTMQRARRAGSAGRRTRRASLTASGFPAARFALLDDLGLTPFAIELPRPQRRTLTPQHPGTTVRMHPAAASLGAEIAVPDAIGQRLRARGFAGAVADSVAGEYGVWEYALADHGPGERGVVLEARAGAEARVRWVNDLGDGTTPVTYPFVDGRGPRDRMMMGMGSMTPYQPGHAVVHLHGAHVAWYDDGYPRKHPPDVPVVHPSPVPGAPLMRPGESRLARYPNDQVGGATLWFHDHLFGLTGPNVYAGLAGSYWLRSAGEARFPTELVEELPVILSDRSFGIDFTDPADLKLTPVYGDPAQMEFYGAQVLVNGVPQPRVTVSRGCVRLRIVNGSNSRFHNLWMGAGSPAAWSPDVPDHAMLLIGTDGGFLREPVVIADPDAAAPDRLLLTLAPGERADVVVDLSALADGDSLVLWTNGPAAPFNPTDFPPAASARDGAGNEAPTPLLQLRAGPAAGAPCDAAALRAFLREESTGTVRAGAAEVDLAGIADELRAGQAASPRRIRASVPAPLSFARRTVTLCEPVPGYPHFALPGDLADEQREWGDPVTERVHRDSVELWEIVNTTGDTHPIHLHLVQFRIVGRFQYDDVEFTQTGNVIPLADTFAGPDPIEAGWKDLVRINPGEVAVIVAAFDLPGHYVYHCHILEHEDAGMMRPFTVLDASRPLGRP